MSDLKLGITVTADGSQAASEMQRLGGAVSGARIEIDAATKSAQQQNTALSSLKTSVVSYVTALAGVGGAVKVLQAADAWGQLSSRMDIAAGSAQAAAHIQDQLAAVADRVYKSVSVTSEGYISTANALAQMGYSSRDTLGSLEALSYGLTVSATDAQRSSLVMDQWSKAMLSGKMNLEQYTSIIGNAPRLQQALADSLGTTSAGLLKLVKDGQLTADKMMLITSQIEKLGAEADQMPVTLGDIGTKLGNAFSQWAGASTTAEGSISSLVAAGNALAANFDLVANAATAVAAVVAGRKVAAMAASTAATMRQQAAETALMQSELAAARAAQVKAAALAQATVMTSGATAAANALTAANQRLAAAQAAMATTATTAGRALSLLGGWPGLIATGAAVAASAWITFGDAAEKEAQRASNAAAAALQDLKDAVANIGNMTRAQYESSLIQARQAVTLNGIEYESIRGAFEQARRNANGVFGDRKIFDMSQQMDEAFSSYQKAKAQLSELEAGANRVGQASYEAFMKNEQFMTGAQRKAHELAEGIKGFDDQIAALKESPVDRSAEIAGLEKQKAVWIAEQQAIGQTASKVKEVKDAFADLNKELQASETGFSKDYGKNLQTLIDGFNAGKFGEGEAAIKKLAAAQKALLQQQPAYKKAIEDAAKAEKERADAVKRGMDAERQALVSLTENNTKLQEQLATLGMNEQQLAEYEAAKYRAAAAADTHTAATLETVAAMQEELQAAGKLDDKSLIKYYRDLAQAKRDSAAQNEKAAELTINIASGKAAVESAKAVEDAYKQSSQAIEQAIYGAIVEGGESAADTLKRTFKALVLQPIIQPIAQATSGMVLGMLGMGSASAAGNGLSMLNNAAGRGGINISNLPFGNSISYGLGSGLASVGSILPGGLGGFFTGMGSGFAGSGAGLGSMLNIGLGQLSGGSIGMGLGTLASQAIPLVGAAALIGSLSGMFKGKTPHKGAVVSSDGYSVGQPLAIDDVKSHYNAAQPMSTWGKFWESDFFKRREQSVADALAPTAQAYAKTLNDALKSLGADGGVSALLGFSADGDSKSRGRASIVDAEGMELAGMTGKYSKDAEEGMAQFVADLGGIMRDTLLAQATEMSDWQRGALEGLGGSPDLDSITGLLQQFQYIDTAAESTAAALGVTAEQIVALGDTSSIAKLTEQMQALAAVVAGIDVFGNDFDVFADGAVGAATALADLAGGVDNLTAAQARAYDALFTEEEKRQHTIEQLTQTFTDMNETLPETIDAYRELLAAQDLTTEAGREMYLTMLDLADAFVSVTESVMAPEEMTDFFSVTQEGLVGLFESVLEQAQSAEEARQMATDAAGDMLVEGMMSAMMNAVSGIIMQSIVGPMMSSMTTAAASSAAIQTAGAAGASATLTAGGGAAASAMAAGGGAAAGAVAGGGGAAAGAMASGGGAAGAAMAGGGAAAGVRVDNAISRVDSAIAGIGAAIGAITSAFQNADVQAAMKEFTSVVGEAAGQLWDGKQSISGGGGGGGGGGFSGSNNNSAADAARALAEEFERLRQSLIDFRDELIGGSFAKLSPEEAYRVAQEAYAEVEAKAAAGDKEAIAELEGVSRDYLKASEAYYASTEAYFKDRDRVLAAVEEAIRYTSQKAGKEIPAFADGGLFSGGLRLVGERGPELEVTGPARYYSAEQTVRMLHGSRTGHSDPLTQQLLQEVLADLRVLIAQGAVIGEETVKKLEVLGLRLDDLGGEIRRAA